MPKVIIESKISYNGGKDNFKLKINNEKIEEIKSEGKTEIDVDYGEQTLQISNNFLMKSPKKFINVESENQEYKITLNFKAWGIVLVLQIIMAILIINQHQVAIFIAILIFILEILILIFMGMIEIKEVKRKEDEIMAGIDKRAKERIFVALDYDNMEDAEKLVEELGDNISMYKVGLESYLNTDGKLVDYLHEKGKKVFLDLKFHDITNTVKMACANAIKKNVFMFNIHCSNGSKTMKEVSELVKESNSESLLIGVTVLTNLGENDIFEMFRSELKLEEIVLNLATLARNSGMHGIVCSPQEAKDVKKKLGKDFVTVCPGVRPKFTLNADGKSNDDQTRIMTPSDAIKQGVDFLVVGRPITKAEDPVKSARLILEEISEAL